MRPAYLEPDAVRQRVRVSRLASGVPARVEDRTAAEQIAAIASTVIERDALREAS